MFIRENEILSDIAEVLSKEPFVQKIIAFGSRIRGDFHGESDFDVFVLVERKNISIRNRIIDVFYEHEMKYNIPFSVTILSKKEFDVNNSMGSPFIRSVIEEGIVIYDAQQRREKISL